MVSQTWSSLQLQKTQFCANTLSVFILAHSSPGPAETQGGAAPSSTRAESTGSPEICSKSGMVFRACVDILQGYTEMLVLRLPVLQQFGQRSISVLRVINWFLIVCSTVAEHICSVISPLDSHQFNFFTFCCYLHNFLICLAYHLVWCFLSKDNQGLRVITLMVRFSLSSCSLSTGGLACPKLSLFKGGFVSSQLPRSQGASWQKHWLLEASNNKHELLSLKACNREVTSFGFVRSSEHVVELRSSLCVPGAAPELGYHRVVMRWVVGCDLIKLQISIIKRILFVFGCSLVLKHYGFLKS